MKPSCRATTTSSLSVEKAPFWRFHPRVAQFADERSGAIKIRFEQNELKVSSSSTDSGESEDTIETPYSFDSIVVGFNSSISSTSSKPRQRRRSPPGVQGCSVGRPDPSRGRRRRIEVPLHHHAHAHLTGSSGPTTTTVRDRGSGGSVGPSGVLSVSPVIRSERIPDGPGYFRVAWDAADTVINPSPCHPER